MKKIGYVILLISTIIFVGCTEVKKLKKQKVK